MRDLIGSRRPFLTFFLDRVLEAGAVHMVFCEPRALSLCPEVSRELWLKPPWKCWRELKGTTKTWGCRGFARATWFLTVNPPLWTCSQDPGGRLQAYGMLLCLTWLCFTDTVFFTRWRFVTALSRASLLASFSNRLTWWLAILSNKVLFN